MSFESNSALGEPKIEDEGDSAGQIVSMGYGGTQMQSGKEAAVEQAGIEVGATYSEDNVGTAPLAREVVTSKDSKGAEDEAENSRSQVVAEQVLEAAEQGMAIGAQNSTLVARVDRGQYDAGATLIEKVPSTTVAAPAAAPLAPTSASATAAVIPVQSASNLTFISASTEGSVHPPMPASSEGAAPALTPGEEQPKMKYLYKPKAKPKPKKLVLPPTPMHYYDPTPIERNATTTLIGAKVCIFWDGEGKYYAAEIVNFNPATGLFQAAYIDDAEPRPLYDEDLTTTVWKIWKGPIKTVAPKVEAPRESTRGNLGRACKVEDYSDMFSDGPKQNRLERSGPHKRSKLSYENMVAEAVYQIADYRAGASLNAVRKYVEKTFSIGKMHVASFNKKTIDGVNTAIANKRIEKTAEKSHTYRPTFEEKTRKRLEAEEKRRKAQEEMNRVRQGGASKSSGSGSSSSKERTKDDYDLNIIGTAVENNRALRQALIEQRNRRDRHLKANMNVLKPFLPEKNYFFRKEAREQKAASSQGQASTGVVRVASDGVGDPVVTVRIEGAEEEEQEKVKDETEVPPIDEASELNSALKDVKMLAIPEQVTATLHEHQSQGISWMVHMYQRGMPMILGDQMGLGKTIQTIGFFAYLKYSLKVAGPFLVVVPLSVLSNWITEINRFCPTLRSVRFHGPKEERARIKSEEMKDLQDFDVVVTTYEVVVSEATWLRRRYMWTSIVVDEGHRLKNEKSQLSEKLRSMPCLSKVILSGTPLQNNLRELWALLHFLAPDVFNNATAQVFVAGFDVVKSVIDNRTLRLSRKLLGSFMLRRLKEHVAITLPSRRELTVLVPLTERQKLLYRHLLCGLDSSTLDMVMGDNAGANGEETRGDSSLKKATSTTSLATSSSVGGGGGGNVMNDTDWRKLMNLLLQLRKICNHTYLMPEMAPNPYKVTEDIVQGSGKLQMLDRLLPKLKADKHRVLIFSQFTSMLDLLEDFCELREHPYARLDGETNRVQRRLDCRRFNASNSPLFIFLISTRAGGLGLNLATADTVILYDSDWNPQVDLQAMERAHRIGQTKPVRVFRLVCSGSIEERMISRAEKKLYLNAMVAEQSEEQIDELGDLADAEQAVEAEDVTQALGIGQSSMSKSELASLIRFGANAVVDSDEGSSAMSEEQLDRLLERQGRDKPYPGDVAPLSSSSSTDKKKGEAVSSELESELQDVLQSRMEKLKEIDLRQLGDTYYASARDRKKGGKGDRAGADSIVWIDDDDDDELGLMVDGKRNRKQRITMVTSAGSGYGGAIPTLSSEWGSPDTAVIPASSLAGRRSRDWGHQEFCCLCGKHRVREGDTMLRCVHCPKIFHEKCLARFDWPKSAMGFICPHHKCQACGRGTAASGGLLFRCVDCLTSYCEDCLPDEEVESIGRCRELEELGYHARQAYYIKCSPCCVDAGIEAKGVHGDALEDGDEEGKAESEGAERDNSMDVEQVTSIDTADNTAPTPIPSSGAEAPATSATSGDSDKGRETEAEAEAEAEAKAKATESADEERGEGVEEEEEEEEDDDDDFLLTQYMKVKWEAETDSEDERDRQREEAKRKRAEKRASAKLRREEAKSKGEDKGKGKGKSKAKSGAASEAKSEAKSKAKAKPARKRARKSRSDEEEEEEEEEESEEDTIGAKRKRRAAAAASSTSTRQGPKRAVDDDDSIDLDSDSESVGFEDPIATAYWNSLGIAESMGVAYYQALDILAEHPAYEALEAGSHISDASEVELATIRDKVLTKRYRSEKAFVADVKHWVSELGKGAKKRGQSTERGQKLLSFFVNYLEERLHEG